MLFHFAKIKNVGSFRKNYISVSQIRYDKLFKMTKIVKLVLTNITDNHNKIIRNAK